MSDKPLAFTDDPGASRSLWVALALILLIAGWFASGMLGDAAETPETAAPRAPAPVRVAVMTSTARPVTETFVAEGQALPDRDTAVRAETTGVILEVQATKGAEVGAETVIARIDPGRRAAELSRAEVELSRAERDLRNAETLLERGTATLDRLAEVRAEFAAAEAALSAAREAMEDTMIRAPFAGRLEELDIDPGEFVAAGTEVARVVDRMPLTVTARIPQQSLGRIRPGQTAEVRFITGETREGTVAFVGSSADPATRTFALEVEVANADGAIPAGVSAEIRIPTGEAVAHFVSPAILALDETGALGLKTVGDDDRVVFHPVDILKAETSGVWVTGLPETARIITVGQGFVRAGDPVDPAPAEAPA